MLGILGSQNIAHFVFNLIPLQPLDGGHIAGALWERIRRGFAKLFRACGAVAERSDSLEVIARRRAFEIGMEKPVVGAGRIGLLADDHRRGLAGKQIGRFGQRGGLFPGAADGDPPAYFDCSFASRAPRSPDSFAA